MSRFVFTLFCAAFFLSCGAKQKAPSHDLKDVNGQPFTGAAFNLAFPTGWVVKENMAFTNVIAIAPKTDGDPFTDSVSVVLENLPEKMTSEQYKTRSLPLLKQVLSDFEVRAESQTKLSSGLSVSTLTYQHGLRDITIVAHAMYVTSGKSGYVITGAADDVQFESFKPTFDKVFESFELDN